jgi:post-segregation antitoxin (ccd killing protein)
MDEAPRSVPRSWYDRGMARTRISTTVDAELLESAREACSGVADSALIDEALAALLARRRAAEFDAAYAAYDEHPLDEADEWGDLASFRAAAGAS